MDKIYEPNDTFPFDKLMLTNPSFLNSGSYFIRYLVNDNPLYIQPPKCVTKQGVIKCGKKTYCDMLFTNENESFIRWIEELENYSQKYIYNNRSKWFESDLEMNDIENSFTPTLKLYKSGKFYIVRTIVPTRLGKCILKIFNENEMDLPIESIQESTNVITIWEIQGIKCSSRSFQIDIEIKQMMVLQPSKMFERCIIGKQPVMLVSHETQETLEADSSRIMVGSETMSNVAEDPITTTMSAVVVSEAALNISENTRGIRTENEDNRAYEIQPNNVDQDGRVGTRVRASYLHSDPTGSHGLQTMFGRISNNIPENDVGVCRNIDNYTDIVSSTQCENNESTLNIPSINVTDINIPGGIEDDVSEEEDEESQEEYPVEFINIEESIPGASLETIPRSSGSYGLEMVDLDINLKDTLEESEIQLKTRNDVYYDIYMDAKKKAEEARNLAISAYLEAKRIKDLYMIHDTRIDGSL